MNSKQILNWSKDHIKQIEGILVAIVLVSTSTAVLFATAAHAGGPSVTTPGNGSQEQEQALTESNQTTLDKNQPAPTFTFSQERQNLINRLKLTSNPNLVGYIYLMGANGQVVANYTVKGKVSSLNSLLTTPNQLRGCDTGQYGGACSVTDSPDMDGSYGANPSGVFFYTTSGAYVEWSGPYMYSNQPMNITSAVTLVQQGQ